jgi:hypothetical protein
MEDSSAVKRAGNEVGVSGPLAQTPVAAPRMIAVWNPRSGSATFLRTRLRMEWVRCWRLLERLT